MIRLLLPLLLIAGALHASDGDYRTFTDDQGRQIQAALIRASDSEAWIRREDGQTFRVALTKFSEEDQKYVAEWRRTEAITAPTAIEFAARRFNDGRRTTSSESTITSIEVYGYEITLTNRSPYQLSDLEIEYRYFIWEGDVGATGQNRRIRHQDGRTRIDSLPPRAQAEFKTDTTTLRSTRLKPNWSYSNSNQRRTKDDLRGVWVRVRDKGNLIAEFSNPAGLMETESW